MLGRLPLGLLALLLATVAHAEPTSLNDPFRHIVQRKPPKAEPPICCLNASPPSESAEQDVLLSFEEWKAKQSQVQAGASSDATDKGAHIPGTERDPTGEQTRSKESKEGSTMPDDLTLSSQAMPESGTQPTETLSPHFRVPITDRFNYASLDCSARVHTAHKGAKSSSSILSSKKDRYMLSPCNTRNVQQFVVVELCEDIRIDTVQLANFEFFSGVFKDFAVSVAKTYNGPWQDAGTYRAKNIRGVQSFHTPGTLSDFYRYIRIDFHSHYGNEYYCPLSLLRVYGLTHLEKWKWELWEAESKAKEVEYAKAAKVALPITTDSLRSNSTPITIAGEIPNDTTTTSMIPITPDPTQPIILGPASPPSKGTTEVPTPNDIESTLSPLTNDTHPDFNDSHDIISTSQTQVLHSTDMVTSPSPAHPPSSISQAPAASSGTTSLASPSSPSSTKAPNTTATARPTTSQVDANGTFSTSSTRSTTSASSPITLASAASSGVPVSPPPPVHAPPLPSGGGESIYRTIMNRLSAIEANHTLYTRYIDQQNGALRDLIKRLGEDIGRLEAITRSQKTTYQKTAGQWEKEKMQMVIDYNQLRSKVDHLAEEIVLEKRLGVFQLCLLLAVLIFMGLTRGSRGEPVVVAGRTGVREWGRRHLSLSGDWSRFVKRTSSSPVRAKPGKSRSVSPSKPAHPDKIHFPRSDDTRWRKPPLEEIQLNTAPLPSEYRARQKKLSATRSRTPSLRAGGAPASAKRTPQTAGPQRSGTPTPIRAAHLRPQLLQPSRSQGNQSSFFPGIMPSKGAKKWARSAHLHPVKAPNPQASPRVERDENSFTFPREYPTDDPFSAPARSGTFPAPGLGKQKYREGELAVLEDEKGRRAPLRMFSFSGDDRDTESNWADTDSVVESDFGDGSGDNSEVDVSR
ncbi:hypothetical protein D9611_011046 [Ephemerocybe angulata]|uniref:SUN domain-containing protein n=1 Tax=Ephemerocybe angulata TaxID=980116 RepID=A0A8H5BBS4_9AGAR|nr:hypothetical protein D9611_011046 [Tulosesus angulatus]